MSNKEIDNSANAAGLLFPDSDSDIVLENRADKEQSSSRWKLMVIDDDEAVHLVTRMVLEDLEYDNRGISIIQGYSASDARRLLRENPDTAVLLLDVVMESDTAGLDLVKYIRDELNYHTLRIILRTGQPGQAPEKQVITQYDINDYKEKSDLTADKLHTSVVAALRAYRDLTTIEALALSNSNLEQRVEERTREIRRINQDLEAQILQREEMNRELRQSESRLARAQVIANVGHWEWDILNSEMNWSDQIYRILGLAPNAIPAKLESMMSFISPEEQSSVSDLIQDILNSGLERYDFEHGLIDSNGLPKFLHQQGEISRDDQGNALKLSGIVQDVTERKIADEKMKKLSGAIEQIADSVMITDATGVIEYVNPAFEQLTLFSSAEVIGKRPSVLKSNKQSQSFYKRMWRTILRGDVFSDVVINCKKDGALYYEEKTITPQKDEQGNITHFISTSKDITERMEAQERLHYLAHHDALTGLPNRALLQDRVNQLIKMAGRHNRKLAVLFLDLDRFKVINDSLGHIIGDRVLQTMSQRLSDCIREGDTVARLGGDEFAVVLDDLASYDDAAAVAEKILTTVTEPFMVEGHELSITTSVGISLFPRDSEDAPGLIKKADVAMYRSKSQGKNTYQYYTIADEAKAAQRLTLESNLRRALERDEFFLEYQPQIDAKTGKLFGVEALIRWKNSDFQIISPFHFIPLLEETGMIYPVSEWVMQTACAQARDWQKNGWDDVNLSVNLSIRQFQRQGLVKQVEQILQQTGLNPRFLDLEVTEGILIDNISETSNTLNELHELGTNLSIDDFGTGYSSMNYLKRLPFDRLKIDKSFTHDITFSEDAAAITTAIINLSHTLGMEVVAEGVETEEQLAFLRKRHCNLIQGYLFSKPVGAAKIIELAAA